MRISATHALIRNLIATMDDAFRQTYNAMDKMIV